MKKKLLFIFAGTALRGSPQSGDIETLYYLHPTHFISENPIENEFYIELIISNDLIKARLI